MKELVLQSESRKQFATFGAAARPYVEGPAVTLAVVLALVTTLTLVAAVEALALAVLLLAVALAVAAAFFFAVGLGFLIVHPAGDLLLTLYLLWLLLSPRQDTEAAFPAPIPELS